MGRLAQLLLSDLTVSSKCLVLLLTVFSNLDTGCGAVLVTEVKYYDQGNLQKEDLIGHMVPWGGGVKVHHFIFCIK